MLSLLFALGSAAAGPTVTADAKSRSPAGGEIATAEAELDFLEFLGGADDTPPDPDAPYDDPAAPSDRRGPAPEGNVEVTP